MSFVAKLRTVRDVLAAAAVATSSLVMQRKADATPEDLYAPRLDHIEWPAQPDAKRKDGEPMHGVYVLDDGRRVPKSHREQVHNALRELQRRGIITPPKGLHFGTLVLTGTQFAAWDSGQGVWISNETLEYSLGGERKERQARTAASHLAEIGICPRASRVRSDDRGPNPDTGYQVHERSTVRVTFLCPPELLKGMSEREAFDFLVDLVAVGPRRRPARVAPMPKPAVPPPPPTPPPPPPPPPSPKKATPIAELPPEARELVATCEQIALVSDARLDASKVWALCASWGLTAPAALGVVRDLHRRAAGVATSEARLSAKEIGVLLSQFIGSVARGAVPAGAEAPPASPETRITATMTDAEREAAEQRLVAEREDADARARAQAEAEVMASLKREPIGPRRKLLRPPAPS